MVEYKVGDMLLRTLVSSPCFTESKIYEIRTVSCEAVAVLDDTGSRHCISKRGIRGLFVLLPAVTRQRPDVCTLLANIGRRLHDVETQNTQQSYEINELYRTVARLEAQL